MGNCGVLLTGYEIGSLMGYCGILLTGYEIGNVGYDCAAVGLEYCAETGLLCSL